jgi:hypothetical protein
MRWSRFILVTGALLWVLVDPAVRLFGDTQQVAGRSGDSVWQIATERPAGAMARDNITGPQAVVTLNKAAFDARLAVAGREFDVATDGVVMTLPMPDGTFERFLVRESPILAPELQAAYPTFKTWVADGLDDPTATARFGWTSAGFHSIAFSAERGTTWIDPYETGSLDTYVVFNKADLQKGDESWMCLVEGQHDEAYHRTENSFPISHGTQLRTYRLALAATAEYTAAAPASGGALAGSKEAALARMTATMNRVNGIYERELSVRMTVATGTVGDPTALIFTNPATDGYTNDDGFAMLTENQSTIDTVVGSANYDIGHVFSTGGGGVAYLRSPCNASQKAGGVTGSSNPTGDPFDVDYVAHEMGHQFGGSHTFNSTVNACGGGNRSSTHAYEVGSGVTIQAYAGICGVEDLQRNSIDRFHVESLDEMTAFLTDGGGSTCGSVSATGNTPPVVGSLSNYTIPLGTPFMLRGSATDSDGDTLTYAWDQFDLGASTNSVVTATTDDGSRPLFRSYAATTDPMRTFPSVSYVLNNANVPSTTYDCTGSGSPKTCLTGETMPTTARTMNFQLTVRDNRSGGGAFSTGSSSVTTVAGTGPFRVTSHNSSATLTGGASMTLTWDVAGTTANGINTANVTIRLSTNGGTSFDTEVVASTANDGSHTFNVPNTATTQARFLLQAQNNIFFDVNDANLTINATGGGSAPSAPAKPTGTAGNGSVTVNWSAPSDGGSPITGYQVQQSTSVDSGFVNVGGGSCPNNNTSTSCTVTGLTNGTPYFFKVAAINSVGTGSYSPASDPLTPVAPCSYALAATSAEVDRLLSNETVSVTTSNSSCAWTASVASGSESMLSISSGASSVGSGTVAYQVSANPGSTTRTGTMTIAGQTFTVTQSADSYTVEISATSGSSPVSGAFVALLGTRKFGAVSSSSGVARFRGVVPGTYTMKAHLGGRSVTSGSITVGPSVISGTLSFSSSSSALTTLGAYGSQTGTIVADGQTGVFYLNTTAIPSLYRTTDHGGTWSPVTLSSDDPATGLDASSTAGSPTTSGYGGEIATVVGNKVWYSFDFGLTWASMAAPTGVSNTQMFWAHINDGVSTVSQLFYTGNSTATMYVADMTASTPAFSAMASSYKTNAGDYVAVGHGNSAPVIAVFDVVSGSTRFWAVDATPASTDTAMVVASLSPTTATDGTTALAPSDVTLFKIGGPATGVSIGSVSAPNTVLLYSLLSTGESNARMAECTASVCSYPLATTFKNADDTNNSSARFSNTGGTSESVSLCAANFGAVGSIAPTGGYGSVGQCWLTRNGTTALEVRAVDRINNNTGLAYDAEYDGSTNLVIISGDGQHGAVKSARMTTGAEASSGLNRPYFPGYPTIAAAGSSTTTGGIAVQGITSAVIRQSLYQPSSATNMASLMSFTGGGRTIGSTDGGTTWFTLADRGGSRMDWWRGATSGSEWIIMGTSGAGEWMWGTQLASAGDFSESTTMPTVKNGGGTAVGPSDFSMTGTIIQTPGVFGVKGISGTDYVALGSYDGGSLRIDLSRLTYSSPSVTLGSLINLFTYAVPDPPMSGDSTSGGATLAVPTGPNAGSFRMAYCPASGSHASVADALFVVMGALETGYTSEVRKFVGIGAGAAMPTPSFAGVTTSSLTPPADSNLRDVAVNCATGTVWFARSLPGTGGGGIGVSGPPGVLKSTDGGATISELPSVSGTVGTALSSIVAIDFNKTTTTQIIAVSRQGDIIVSDDEGATWRMVNDTSQAACVGSTTQCGRGFGGEEPGSFSMPPVTGGGDAVADVVSGAPQSAVSGRGVLGSGAGLFSVSLDGPPTVTASPSVVRMGATRNGPGGSVVYTTAAQEVVLDFSSTSPAWTATASAPWIQLNTAAFTGTGDGRITVTHGSFDSLGTATTASGSITITIGDGSIAPLTIPVHLTISDSPSGSGLGPVGQVDTPLQNATGVQGAIGVTGWAVDDVGVASVRIYRNCIVGLDNPASCQTVLGQSLVFIGNAAFLAGARTDVEGAYSGTYPQANRAGWGYLMLTSMLPNVTASLPNGGVGTLTIYAVATDIEGNQTLLGRSADPASPSFTTPTTITMSNDTIAKPFGAIDTPEQGETRSGVINNFGWALTPDSNTTGSEVGDILVPTNGSTATVFINSLPVAQVTYNQCRGTVGNPPGPSAFCNDDVASIFGHAAPQATFTTRTENPTRYRNLDAGRGAIGSYSFNSATLGNGLHTIAWSVTDSSARTEGIGSRFFNVLNSGADQAMRPADILGHALFLPPVDTRADGVWGRTGYDLSSAWVEMHADGTGVYRVRLPESGRLELWLGEAVDAGYLVAQNGTLRELPVGSTLDGAWYGWMPPVGYVGPYWLAFVRDGVRVDVVVTVGPTRRAAEGESEIRMHLDPVRVEGSALSERSVRVDGPALSEPSVRIDGPALSERFVRVEGWAYDPQAAIESGIGAVHVWARRLDATGAAGTIVESVPVFLGEARVAVARPDVARVVEGAPGHTGFGLDARLATGTWELTAYVWNVRTGRFEDARSLVTIVR